MSAYLTLPTPMTDEALLLAAIAQCDPRASLWQRSDVAVKLRGWQAGRTAHVVLRREHALDAYNDIGFLAGPTGYTAVLSDDHGYYNRAWLLRVHVAYEGLSAARAAQLAEAERQRQAERKRQLVEQQRLAVLQKAKKLGYQVQEHREGDTVRLVLVKRTYA